MSQTQLDSLERQLVSLRADVEFAQNLVALSTTTNELKSAVEGAADPFLQPGEPNPWTEKAKACVLA
eukprot:CAMPEP_0114622302 /NCGR_PEP_ID=MMETSP0168-20121206/9670_1 /TAXON_ID=95228 ORGANISM="Vannella sp., Strain DIVA3 517/6/12" /NCGR_SAMPLE_ID=MMETSP0168 /ASSEMBLY_ACC=CAM_ASM_000044 /LENGTH=66 /DNA_ID=CAMNT_0001833519 /DNA_START=34 /DNA_END=234 /DNA_ORIENTATION=-